MGDPTRFEEVVFSGFGEPTLRLDVVKEVAGELKRRGAKRIRLVTNGLANKTHERNILPELGGLVDAISISMQAESPEAYAKICKTKDIEDPYPLVKEFVRWAKNYIPEVEVTAVNMSGLIDIEACEKVADRGVGRALPRARLRADGLVGQFPETANIGVIVMYRVVELTQSLSPYSALWDVLPLDARAGELRVSLDLDVKTEAIK